MGVACSGLYADTGSLKQTVIEGFQSLTEEVGHLGGRKERLYHLQKAVANSIEMEEDGISAMQDEYDMYKEGNIKFLRFNPDEDNLQKESIFTARVQHAPLEAVYIFFDTATYNEIERDVKVTTEAQLGLIGGT